MINSAQSALEMIKEHPLSVDIHFAMTVWEILFPNMMKSLNALCVGPLKKSPLYNNSIP